MIGREDYEERKQSRIHHLNDAAYRASKESDSAIKRSHDLVKDIPLGQPNIHGALTGVMNKSRNAASRAVDLAEKSNYYAGRAESAENNHTISSDDPKAVEKLENKLVALELQREEIKAFNKAAKKNGTESAPWYALPYIGKDIKRIKERIEKLKRIDDMPAETIQFDGGEIISDVETNRIKIVFDERQSDDVTEKLKRNGFHWARSEGAWQRLRNQNALYAAKKICGIIK